MTADDAIRLYVRCPHCAATNRLPAARIGGSPNCGRCARPLLDGSPIAIDDASFDAVAAASSLPLVVDFWAPWCGPCRAMAPAFEAAGKSLAGRALLAKVNSDENPLLSQRYAIRSIPTLLLLSRGREVGRQSGAVSAAAVVAFAGV